MDGNYNAPATFQAIRKELGSAQRPAHYLAIPPVLFGKVVEPLGAAGCAGKGTRVIVEKPMNTSRKPGGRVRLSRESRRLAVGKTRSLQASNPREDYALPYDSESLFHYLCDGTAGFATHCESLRGRTWEAMTEPAIKLAGRTGGGMAGLLLSCPTSATYQMKQLHCDSIGWVRSNSIEGEWQSYCRL